MIAIVFWIRISDQSLYYGLGVLSAFPPGRRNRQNMAVSPGRGIEHRTGGYIDGGWRRTPEGEGGGGGTVTCHPHSSLVLFMERNNSMRTAASDAWLSHGVLFCLVFIGAECQKELAQGETTYRRAHPLGSRRKVVVRELLLIAWRYKLSQADEAEKVLKAFLYLRSMTSLDSLVSSVLGCV